MTLDFDFGGHRLRVISITQTGDVSLREFEGSDKRLVMVVPVERWLDDGATMFHCFNLALGDRGLLSSVRMNDLAALALDLAVPADVAAEWLKKSDVTVAALGVPAELMAATVIAADAPVGEALEAVRRLVPDALVSPEEEVTLSVAKDHTVLRQDLNRRRLAHVARGGGYWDISE